MEALTGAQHSGLASEVALAKAAWFLNHQAFGDAVCVLKVCQALPVLLALIQLSICSPLTADCFAAYKATVPLSSWRSSMPQICRLSVQVTQAMLGMHHVGPSSCSAT